MLLPGGRGWRLVHGAGVKPGVARDDRNKYAGVFDRVAKGAGMRVVKTAVQAPLMNATCERFLGSVRRECLDHLIILDVRHLLHVLKEYALGYFDTARPHQGIGQRIPVSVERHSHSPGGKTLRTSCSTSDSMILPNRFVDTPGALR
jgi:hypothetical protein